MTLKLLRTLFISVLFSVPYAASAEIVNINDASAGAISHYLKGIGDVKAESIVSYRELNGDFKSLDDLVKVKGIGEGLLSKNRSDLSLTEGVVKWIKAKPKLVVLKSKATKNPMKLNSEKVAAKSVKMSATQKSKKIKTTETNTTEGDPLKQKAAGEIVK